MALTGPLTRAESLIGGPRGTRRHTGDPSMTNGPGSGGLARHMIG